MTFDHFTYRLVIESNCSLYMRGKIFMMQINEHNVIADELSVRYTHISSYTSQFSWLADVVILEHSRDHIIICLFGMI